MIIGLVGFIGSGKGTVADILVNKHDFHKVSFADSVKDAASVIFGWPRELLEGDTEESRQFRETIDEWWSDNLGYIMTPRLALQMIGTEVGRDIFHPDLWILSLERKLELESFVARNLVVPDVRFPNEIAAIRAKGGIVVRVKRGPEPDWWDVAEKVNAANANINVSGFGNLNPMVMSGIHISEWSWIGSKFDLVINNDQDIHELEENVFSMLYSNLT